MVASEAAGRLVTLRSGKKKYARTHAHTAHCAHTARTDGHFFISTFHTTDSTLSTHSHAHVLHPPDARTIMLSLEYRV